MSEPQQSSPDASQRMPSARILHPRHLAIAAALAVAMQGCGGGDGASGATAQPEAAGVVKAVYEGPVSGFGSVIVNGVRFRDGSARVVDEDGADIGRDRLTLGTRVSVEGTADDDGGVGDATRITVLPELRGAIEAIDVAGASLTVMGTRVTVAADTVFRGFGALADLAVGDTVEVHGSADPGGVVQATLIEKRSIGTAFFVSGAAADVDPDAKTFRIGALTVRFADAVLRPSGATVAEGSVVRVRAALAPAAGVVDATRIQVYKPSTRFAADGVVAIKGIVESAADAGGRMRVAGVEVDASRIPGAAARAPVGARIRVLGRFEGEVLVASRLRSDDERRREGRADNELHGLVTSVDDATHFVVKGVVVDASAATFVDPAALGVKAGLRVDVEGVVARGAGGVVLKASKVVVRAAGTSGDDDTLQDGRHKTVYGQVTAIASGTRFDVDGVHVDASGVAAGELPELALGAFVEVEGAAGTDAEGGRTLVATKVERTSARVGGEGRR
ncbi:MAG: DUF5666 domain-containing protein [Lautropia sp.]